MRNENIITKFRVFWKALSLQEKEELWDIMTALRGSDAGVNDDVKYATTARIRGELLGESYHRGYTFPTFFQAKKNISSWVTYPAVYSPREVVNHYQDKPHHFKAHVRHAIEVLNRYRPKSAMRDLQKFLRRF